MDVPPLEEHVPPDCRQCDLCRELRPIVANHEGIGGVAATAGVAMAFSYAPSLRAGDRIVVHPDRGFPDVFPTWACAPIPARQLHDPFRIDAGEAPELVHVLDRSGRARILDERGSYFDATRGRGAPIGADIAADGNVPYHTAVLTGNQVAVGSLRCFLGCGAAEVAMADERSLQRRDRVGELIPDYAWWHRALAFRGPLALLDAGRSRVVLRQGFPCGAIDVPFCTDRTCHRQQECPLNPTDRPLLGGESLQAARDPFRAFSDLAYDPTGTLWVLARDGSVVGLDRFGRNAGEVALQGLGRRSLEALAADTTGFYVLGSDGRISKHARDGSLRAAWFPQTQAGPGRYEDLSVAPDGRVLVVDGEGQRVLVFAPSLDVAPPPAEPQAPGCRLVLGKSAAPDPVMLGERIDIRLGLELQCPPRDIVIAVDGSCQMAGSRLAAARAASRALISELDLDQDRVALAVFGDRPGGWRSIASLGSRPQDLDEAAAALPSDCRPVQLFPDRRNDARIAEGLRAGRQLLFGPGSREEARKILVLAAASTIDRQHVEAEGGRVLAGQELPLVRDREHAVFEAKQLWSRGVRIHTFGLGMPDRPLGPPPQPTPDLQSSQPPDEGILAAVALPAEAYALADPPEQLGTLWQDLAATWRAADRIDDLAVTDLLPDDMRLLPGSASPPATPVGDGLAWRIGTLRSGRPITLTLAVTPTVSGLRATNAEALAEWRDPKGSEEQAIFPVPVVRVIAPAPTGTPSPTATASPTTSPTQEATTAPTAEATPTAEPSAAPRSPTALPDRRRLFLPTALQHRCKPVAVALDVVLLLDSSSSMQGAKLDAAREASGIFLTLLELGRDRVALVRFDGSDEVLVPLTADGEAVRNALRDLRTDVGTRIDLGLIAASDHLATSKRPRTDQVIVLLTDGRPELGSEEEAVRVAASAREAGVAIWAVGLGREVPVSLLDAITGDPTRVRLAPDAGGLVAIYESIARLLPCR